jgi:hypothetical protein
MAAVEQGHQYAIPDGTVGGYAAGGRPSQATQPTQVAQNNPASSANPGVANDGSSFPGGKLPFGGRTPQESLINGTNLMANPGFTKAPESFQAQVKNNLAQVKALVDMQNTSAGLPANKIPAEITARREQGIKAGLTGAALETFALTGNPAKPGDEMTPAQKKVSEKFGEQQIKYTEDLSAGRKSVNILTQMDKLISDPNFYSGSGGPLATRVKQFGVALGLVDKNAASSNEVFRSLANQLTLAANNGSLGAGVSNSDVSFLQTINPNEELSPEANKRLVKIAMADAQRKIDLGRMSNEYAQKHGQLDEGFNDLVFNYDERKRTEAEARDAQSNQPNQPQQNRQQRNDGANLSAPPANELAEARRAISHGVPLSAVTEHLRGKGFNVEGL